MIKAKSPKREAHTERARTQARRRAGDERRRRPGRSLVPPRGRAAARAARPGPCPRRHMDHGPPRAAARAPLRSRLGARTRKNHGSHGLGAPAGPGGAGGRSAHTTPHMSQLGHMLTSTCVRCRDCATENRTRTLEVEPPLDAHAARLAGHTTGAQRQTPADTTGPTHDKFTTQTAAALSFDELTLQCRAYTSRVPTYTDHGPRGCA